MLVSLNCVTEDHPGEKWQELFDKSWPYYKKWYTSEGLLTRPGYLTCTEQLEKYMPELMPVYQKLTELAGGGDIASRYLSLYNPPPFMSGCTQLAWTRPPVSLIRNYDYDPRLFEGVMLKTNWLKPVIGIADCNWGLLDGMNADGLVVSLTFGGSKIVGEGFGIPLILRYVLETCSTVEEAQKAFFRIPVHMAYNVTIIDKSGAFSTLYLFPGHQPVIADTWVATNHQSRIEWNEYAVLTGTLERKQFLEEIMVNPYTDREEVLKKFFQPPLYHNKVKKAFVTLYTADYNLEKMSIRIMWPGKELEQSFSAYHEKREIVNLSKVQKNELTR